MLLGFAGQQVFLQTERVRDDAMAPIIRSGMDLVVDNMAYWADDPIRGTIVNVGAPSGHAARHMVGLPGEEVALRGGQLSIDGQPCDGREIHGKACFFAMAEGERPADFGPLVLGPEEYFLLANRADAEDSRSWGPLPRAAIFGIVRFNLAEDNPLLWESLETPVPEPTEAPS
jgi:signal peptidase I